MTLTVRAPTWEIVAYKSRTEVPAGQEAQFSFTIRAQERFSGSAAFRLGEVPPDWPAALDRGSIGDGEPATVRVGVPTGAALGEYRVEVLSERGDVVSLTVVVSERYPDPRIASIEPPSGLAGEEAVLYGYGFGDAGTVRIGGLVMPVTAHGREAITVRVPEGASTGPVTVERDGLVSEGCLFYVKNEGFRLLPQGGEVRLQPGESRDVDLAVAGHARSVSLAADCPNPQVRVSLEPSVVVPNALSRLRIEAAAETAAGTWPVTVTAAGEGRSVTATVSVVVGETFAFDTTSLPTAMEGATYRAELACRQGTAPVRYSLVDGQLPEGLSLSIAGVIGGRPGEVGERRFTVLAEDAEGRQARAELFIRVEENSWAQADKDGGRSRSNPVPSPADGRRRWTSQAFAGAGGLLTGRGRVFVRAPFEVIGLEAATGALVYRHRGEAVQWAYGAETLFLLESGGAFQALESRYGQPKWRREGVDRFTTDGSLLLLAAGERTLVLEAAAGRLVRELELALPEVERCLWQRGELLRLRERGLDRLATAGDGSASWQPLYESGAARIAAAAADTDGTALLLEGGRLVLLDADGRVAAEADTGLAVVAGTGDAAGAQLVLGGERLAVAAGGRLAGFRRAGLATLYQRAVEAGPVAGAAEKLFVAGSTRLTALNGYDGGEIWSREEAQVEAALAGERLYGLDGQGRVSAYDGPDNLSPPTTTVAVSPAAPDGENGWYVSLPRVGLEARDPESAVAGTWYRLGEGPETAYEEAFIVPEGGCSLVAWSADNHGFREPDRVRAFKVDITAPESRLETSGTAGAGGYHVSAVRLSLSATDGGSGVERIEYHLGDGVWRRYGEELVLAAEGDHLVGWRARDNAGNYEPERTASFRLDLADPEVQARTSVEPGLAVVRLEGSDSASGVERLEYRLDGGAENAYLDPLMLTRPGPHTVAYRAADRAGRTSAWTDLAVTVPPFDRGTWILGLEFPDWKPGREVVREVQEGERMYAPSQGSHNRIERLPAYLVGADYLRFHNSDGNHKGEWIARFTAGADLEVYVLKHASSQADLTGWTLVEQDFPVQPKQLFEGGADVYRRSYRKGETVTIPASRMVNGKGFGNLAFAQYRLSNYLRIVSPEPGTALTAAARVRYAGAVLLEGAGEPRWSWRPEGEPGWRPLGSGASGEWALPEQAGQVELRIEAQAPGGGRWDERVEGYAVRVE